MLSTSYQAELEALHKRAGNRWGSTGHRYAFPIAHWATLWGCQSILDFGCGKGTLAYTLGPEGFDVREYDPGIPGKDTYPLPADCVVSTDVLEHVEPRYVEDTLEQLSGLTIKCGWHLIAQYPASARDNLSDGRNAHLTILNTGEWLRLFKQAFPDAQVDARDYIRPGREGRKPKPACIITVQRK